jgi:NAD(P)-dependent dehydrogenase (short-subunit alcohol dehydrogenase family)
MQLEKARILLVGGTGVLGGRLAKELTARGARVVVTGRDPGRLHGVAEDVGAEHQVQLDLVDLEGVAAAVDEAAERLGGLDGLVVASGVAAFGSARDEDDAIIEELFAVNTVGPMVAIRAALRHLGGGAGIAVLTAILADMPVAGMAAYSASKAALSAYLTALRHELRRDGISVLDARPPHMETGLADRPLAGEAPRLPPGHDIDEVVELIITGLAGGRSELVANPKERTISLR